MVSWDVARYLLRAHRQLVELVALLCCVMGQQTPWVVTEGPKGFSKLSFVNSSGTAIAYSIHAPGWASRHLPWSSSGVGSGSSVS